MKLMRNPRTRLAHVGLALAFLGATLPALHSAAKPDKKKSQAAYQRGQRADQAGRREEAIGEYSEALELDAGNTAALRARGSAPWSSSNRTVSRLPYSAAACSIVSPLPTAK